MKTWENKLDTYFKAFCRRAFHWSPEYKEARKRAFVKKVGQKEYYKCAGCGIVVLRRLSQLDHIRPVQPIDQKWDRDWNSYRDRVMVTADGLQCLCKRVCHQEKTNKENCYRRMVKKPYV